MTRVPDTFHSETFASFAKLLYFYDIGVSGIGLT